jgi:hypothetical protein
MLYTTLLMSTYIQVAVIIALYRSAYLLAHLLSPVYVMSLQSAEQIC